MKVWMDDASSLADAVRRREVRAADALEASLDAIQRSELNTVVTLDAEGARWGGAGQAPPAFLSRRFPTTSASMPVVK